MLTIDSLFGSYTEMKDWRMGRESNSDSYSNQQTIFTFISKKMTCFGRRAKGKANAPDTTGIDLDYFQGLT